MGQNDSQLNRDFSQSKSAWEFRKLRQVSISYPNDIQTHAKVTVIVGILVFDYSKSYLKTIIFGTVRWQADSCQDTGKWEYFWRFGLIVILLQFFQGFVTIVIERHLACDVFKVIWIDYKVLWWKIYDRGCCFFNNVYVYSSVFQFSKSRDFCFVRYRDYFKACKGVKIDVINQRGLPRRGFSQRRVVSFLDSVGGWSDEGAIFRSI